MKPIAPSLAPLLRSNTQGDLLALLLMRPESEFTLTEIVRHIGSGLTTVHREVDRLVEMGLFVDRRVGAARLVRANTSNRLYEPTRALIQATYGPKVVIESAMDGVPGIAKGFIFGSWAARYCSEPGLPPNDVDVLVVGEVGRLELAELAAGVEMSLHREVNIERVSEEAWNAKEGPFLQMLAERPLVELDFERAAA